MRRSSRRVSAGLEGWSPSTGPAYRPAPEGPPRGGLSSSAGVVLEPVERRANEAGSVCSHSPPRAPPQAAARAPAPADASSRNPLGHAHVAIGSFLWASKPADTIKRSGPNCATAGCRSARTRGGTGSSPILRTATLTVVSRCRRLPGPDRTGTVQGDEEHGVVPEDVLCAVAVVHVPVEDGDATGAELRLREAGGDGDVVEKQSPSRAPIGVVPGGRTSAKRHVPPPRLPRPPRNAARYVVSGRGRVSVTTVGRRSSRTIYRYASSGSEDLFLGSPRGLCARRETSLEPLGARCLGMVAGRVQRRQLGVADDLHR